MMGKMSANVTNWHMYDYLLQRRRLPLTYKVIAAGKTEEDINNTMCEMMRTNTWILIPELAKRSTLMRYLPKE